MDEWIHRWIQMDGYIDGCMDTWMDGNVVGWMDGCIDA